MDLNSDKQGLLLPRIIDYTVAPLSTAPDGMLIYYVPDKLLYIKKNGIWRKLIDETNGITSVNGQTGPVVTLTTNNISESVNLYYTDTRARSAFSAGTGINLSGTGVISALNTSAIWNANSLQGVSVSSAAPATGQVLTYNGSSWAPAAAASGGSAGPVTTSVLSYEDAGMPGTVNADATMYTIAFRSTTYLYPMAATVNLPKASTCPGRMYVIAGTATSSGYGQIKVQAASGDMIGAIDNCMLYKNMSVQLQSSGNYWIIIAKSSTNTYYDPYNPSSTSN